MVLPHPDDEISAWSMIEDTPSDYKVFVDLTQGESIGACDPRIGPGVYDRTVNVAGREPGANPPGTPYAPGLDPWVGTGEEQISSGRSLPDAGCREARFDSQAGFISSEANYDPSLPIFATATPTEWCFSSEPNGKDPCMEVLATTSGAIVSFDLGDMDWCGSEVDCESGSAAATQTRSADRELADHPYALQPNDVAWAVQNVVHYASTILPVSLPVGKIIAGGFLNPDSSLGTRWNLANEPATPPSPPSAGTCDGYGQPQHWVTDTVIHTWILAANVPQFGRTCSGDTSADLLSIDPTTYRRLIGNSSASVVDGEWPLSYGWMDGSGLDPPGGTSDPHEICDTTPPPGGILPAEGITSCNQAFWRVQGATVSVNAASPSPPQLDPSGPWDYSRGGWRA